MRPAILKSQAGFGRRGNDDGARTPPPQRNGGRLSTKSGQSSTGLSYPTNFYGGTTSHHTAATHGASATSESNDNVDLVEAEDISVTSKSFEGTRTRRSRRDRVNKKEVQATHSAVTKKLTKSSTSEMKSQPVTMTS